MTGLALQFSDNDVEIVKREECYRGHFRVDRLSLRHRLHPIATFYPSAGACSEQIRAFMGRVVTAGVGEVHGLADEHEDLLVHAVPREEALRLLDSDRVNNGHTLIALHWLARHGDALRQEWLNS